MEGVSCVEASCAFLRGLQRAVAPTGPAGGPGCWRNCPKATPGKLGGAPKPPPVSPFLSPTLLHPSSQNLDMGPFWFCPFFFLWKPKSSSSSGFEL